MRLEGGAIEIAPFAGEILRELQPADPISSPLVRCGNRRSTRCPSCDDLYRQDTSSSSPRSTERHDYTGAVLWTPTPRPRGPAPCSICAAPSPPQPVSHNGCYTRSSGSRTRSSPSTSSAE
ncbi:hypothetical protein AB0H29_20335 [Streptomyces thermolilacinus]